MRCADYSFRGLRSYRRCALAAQQGQDERGRGEGEDRVETRERNAEERPLHRVAADQRRVHDRIARADRKRLVEGKSVSVRVDLGGRRIHTKKTKIQGHTNTIRT